MAHKYFGASFTLITRFFVVDVQELQSVQKLLAASCLGILTACFPQAMLHFISACSMIISSKFFALDDCSKCHRLCLSALASCLRPLMMTLKRFVPLELQSPCHGMFCHLATCPCRCRRSWRHELASMPLGCSYYGKAVSSVSTCQWGRA